METFTSKNSPVPVASEVVVGFEAYLATVRAPTPVAVAVTIACRCVGRGRAVCV